MEKLKEFQRRIGYQFQREGLLRQALTHSSYANEHRMRRMSDNERLEFLGDRVLGVAIASLLYKMFPMEPEGSLSRRHTGLVCKETVAEVEAL